ncbi:hypothetical protein Ga0074812_104104 [Parafrankia irregularis]|uniref:Uncharacterized protein n=1 Tax=Parafrankia irregularis TaxID=795642 RepID=A0A0S4QIR2_9ACTN|nr:hypothetical protein [Parafrankia irregularis]CUU55023.1 hypothetical protein Ga0074812_104104 [Parafrankia irregularis]
MRPATALRRWGAGPGRARGRGPLKQLSAFPQLFELIPAISAAQARKVDLQQYRYILSDLTPADGLLSRPNSAHVGLQECLDGCEDSGDESTEAGEHRKQLGEGGGPGQGRQNRGGDANAVVEPAAAVRESAPDLDPLGRVPAEVLELGPQWPVISLSRLSPTGLVIQGTAFQVHDLQVSR